MLARNMTSQDVDVDMVVKVRISWASGIGLIPEIRYFGIGMEFNWQCELNRR